MSAEVYLFDNIENQISERPVQFPTYILHVYYKL